MFTALTRIPLASSPAYRTVTPPCRRKAQRRSGRPHANGVHSTRRSSWCLTTASRDSGSRLGSARSGGDGSPSTHRHGSQTGTHPQAHPEAPGNAPDRGRHRKSPVAPSRGRRHATERHSPVHEAALPCTHHTLSTPRRQCVCGRCNTDPIILSHGYSSIAIFILEGCPTAPHKSTQHASTLLSVET